MEFKLMAGFIDLPTLISNLMTRGRPFLSSGSRVLPGQGVGQDSYVSILRCHISVVLVF